MKMIAALLLACVAVVAADPGGRWNVAAQTASGREYKLALSLKQDAGKWTGEMDSERGTVPLTDVHVTGNAITYKFAVGDADYDIKLTLSGDALKGTFTGTNGASGTLAGTRAGSPQPAAATAVTADAASLAGTWKGSAKTASGKIHNVRITLRDEQGKWHGSIATDEGEAPMTNLKVAGSEVSFEVQHDSGTFHVKLSHSGSELKGTFTGPGENGTMTLTR